MTTNAQDDLLEFAIAIGEGFPHEPHRDRFGRTVSPRHLDRLRNLSMKYKCPGAYDSEEQAGNVARAIVAAVGENTSPTPDDLDDEIVVTMSRKDFDQLSGLLRLVRDTAETLSLEWLDQKRVEFP